MPYFSLEPAANSAKDGHCGQGYGLASGLAGSETQREPREQKTRRPCSSPALWLERPDLHGCSIPEGPARSGIAHVTDLSAGPPLFLPLPARHVLSSDSPCGATRVRSLIQRLASHTLHAEAGFAEI